jgi:hypothetical protein
MSRVSTADIANVSQHSTADLLAQEPYLRAAPSDVGSMTMLVRRPDLLTRELLAEGVIDAEEGLLGDTWLARATRRSLEGGRHFDAQITVMSSRMVGLLADDEAGRAEAGDQLYVDLDISVANLPTGTRIAIGEDGVVLEVSAKPHNGCAKFVSRFGREAMEFVNSPLGKELRLRGFNARVVEAGTVRPGDVVRVQRRGA